VLSAGTVPEKVEPMLSLISSIRLLNWPKPP